MLAPKVVHPPRPAHSVLHSCWQFTVSDAMQIGEAPSHLMLQHSRAYAPSTLAAPIIASAQPMANHRIETSAPLGTQRRITRQEQAEGTTARTCMFLFDLACASPMPRLNSKSRRGTGTGEAQARSERSEADIARHRSPRCALHRAVAPASVPLARASAPPREVARYAPQRRPFGLPPARRPVLRLD